MVTDDELVFVISYALRHKVKRSYLRELIKSHGREAAANFAAQAIADQIRLSNFIVTKGEPLAPHHGQHRDRSISE